MFGFAKFFKLEQCSHRNGGSKKKLSYLTQVVLSLKSYFRASNAPPPPKKVLCENFNQTQRGFAKPMQYNSNSKPITCFNCGKQGHSAQDCWSKTKNSCDNNSFSPPTAYDTDNASVNSNRSFQEWKNLLRLMPRHLFQITNGL